MRPDDPFKRLAGGNVTRGSRILRIAAIAVLVLVVSTLVTPWGRVPRSWAVEWYHSTVDKPVAVPVTATTVSDAELSPEFTAAHLVDGNGGTAWASAVDPTVTPGTSCTEDRSVAKSRVHIDLNQAPGHIDRVGVLPGLMEDVPERDGFTAPKILDLGFSNGLCQRIALNPSPVLRYYSLSHSGAVSWIEVTIAEVVAPDAGRVAISELRFERLE